MIPTARRIAGILALAALAGTGASGARAQIRQAAGPAPGPVAITPATAAGDPATEPLRRLFFPADRRQALDRLRLLNVQESQPQIEDPTVTVNGVVKRSGGPETAWINGAPQTENSPGAIWSGSVGPASRIRLTPPGETSRQVKVGETLHRGSGDVSSPLLGGRISVNTGPSAGLK